MARKCGTCQHVKRAEIDRRLASGEPCNQVAADHKLNPSSLHRHRSNCLGLASSNAIMKDVSRRTAAVACLPSKEELGGEYPKLRDHIDQIGQIVKPRRHVEPAPLQVEQQSRQDRYFILALRQVTVEYDTLMAVCGLEIGMLAEKVCGLGPDRLGEQATPLFARFP